MISEKFKTDYLLEEKMIKHILDSYFRKKLLKEESKKLPENDFLKIEDYEKELKGYAARLGEANEYNEKNPKEQKTDFIDKENTNIGWKLHLNVEPRFVKNVSKYLKQNGYVHKFLSGGNPGEGKVFTVYIGSFSLAKKLAKQLSNDLLSFISRPTAVGEIELASGIVGRFSGDKKIFSQYGTCGFSNLRQDQEAIVDLYWDNKFFRKMAEEKAFKKLRELYGDYFFSEK